MKKRHLALISLILAFVLAIFSGCGESRLKYQGDPGNYTPISGDFAENGLATKMDTSVDFSFSSLPLTRTEENFPDTDVKKLNDNRNATLEIYSFSEGSTGETSIGAGSGVIVGFIPSNEVDLSKGGTVFIVTCFHVVDGAYGVNIRNLNGEIFSAGLIGADTENDIALLWSKIDFEPSVAVIGGSTAAQVGETVYAIGNPTGTLGGTVTKGIVSAKERSITVDNKEMTLMQIDSAVNNGNSGGGLFTADGYLIGMVNAGITYKDGLGFAIPTTQIVKSLSDLIETYKDSIYKSYGYIKNRASIGVTLSELGGIYYQIDGEEEVLTLTNAVCIAALYETGSFGKSDKLQAGNDVIYSIDMGDGEAYTPSGSQDALDYIRKHDNFKVGNTLKLSILRYTGSQYVASLRSTVYVFEKVEVEVTLVQLIYCPPSVPSSETEEANVLNGGQTATDGNTIEPMNVTYSSELEEALTFKSYIGEFLGEKSVFNLAVVSLVRADDSDSVLTKCRKSVVELYATSASGGSAGSGIIIGFQPDEEGDGGICFIVTCHHCVDGAYNVNVKDFYGNLYATGLIGSDMASDVALLWTRIDYVPEVASFGDFSELYVADGVYAIGNPTGTLGGTVSKGIVSALARDVLVDNRYMTLMQIDTPINAGNSGGGLFSEDGLLVGLVNAGQEYKDGLGFAVPSDKVLSVVNSLLATYNDDVYRSYGYVNGRVDIYSVVYEDYSSFMGFSSGVQVTAIDEKSSAYLAGLRVGDYLKKVVFSPSENTKETLNVESASDLAVFLASLDLRLGDKLTLTYERGSYEYTVKITLGQYIYTPPSQPQQN